MTSKSIAGLLMALLASACFSASAQFVDDADWKESEVPAPPTFDLGKLVSFESAIGSSLVYGVDPSTVQITGTDSLVRYMMVATSPSGARNVMYEAIRCATGEFKTYARATADGRWTAVKDPQWRSMFGNMPSKHALVFAKAGACENAAPVQDVRLLVSRLKNPAFRTEGTH